MSSEPKRGFPEPEDFCKECRPKVKLLLQQILEKVESKEATEK